MQQNFIIVDGKKFMWDGQSYDSRESARDAVSRYGSDGFETELVEAEGKHFVYTRRTVQAVAVEQPG